MDIMPFIKAALESQKNKIVKQIMIKLVTKFPIFGLKILSGPMSWLINLLAEHFLDDLILEAELKVISIKINLELASYKNALNEIKLEIENGGLSDEQRKKIANRINDLVSFDRMRKS